MKFILRGGRGEEEREKEKDMVRMEKERERNKTAKMRKSMEENWCTGERSRGEWKRGESAKNGK